MRTGRRSSAGLRIDGEMMTAKWEVSDTETAVSDTCERSGASAHKCVRCHAQGRCVLESLSSQSRDTLKFHLRENQVGDGSTIFAQDEPAHRLHVVKSGAVLVCHRSISGPAIPVGFFGPGIALGKLAPFAEHDHVFSAVSVGSSRICSVSTQVLRSQPQIQRELAQALPESLLRFQREMAAWSVIARMGNLQDRLAQALQQLARSQRSNRVQLPPHRVLAALLGTTRESVARTLARMRTLRHLESAGHKHVQLGPQLELSAPLLE